MAKKDDSDYNMAEDYLAQLRWKSDRMNSRYAKWDEPRWRYKPVYKQTPLTPAGRILIGGFLFIPLAILGSLVYDVIHDMSVGETVFAVVVLLMFLSITFFAARDIQETRDEEDQ